MQKGVEADKVLPHKTTTSVSTGLPLCPPGVSKAQRTPNSYITALGTGKKHAICEGKRPKKESVVNIYMKKHGTWG